MAIVWNTHLVTALCALEVHAAAPGQGVSGLAVRAPHPVLLQEHGELELLRVGVVELEPLGKLFAADVLVGLRPLKGPRRGFKFFCQLKLYQYLARNLPAKGKRSTTSPCTRCTPVF